MELKEAIKDLIKQANTENSHYYTAGVLRMSLAEINSLQAEVADLKAKLEEAQGQLCGMREALFQAINDDDIGRGFQSGSLTDETRETIRNILAPTTYICPHLAALKAEEEEIAKLKAALADANTVIKAGPFIKIAALQKVAEAAEVYGQKNYFSVWSLGGKELKQALADWKGSTP